MKKLLLLTAILLASCNKNCDAELQRINEQYASAMANAGPSQAARNEITRQYNDKVNDLNCD